MSGLHPSLTTTWLTRLAFAGGSLLCACSDRPVAVDVQVTVDAEPARGVEVLALPYDPRIILDSLAAAAPSPRPDFSGLEAELRIFRRPPIAEEGPEAVVWEATRDSVERLADSLRAVDRRSPGYAAAYQGFRRLYTRLVERAAVRDAARRELTADVRSLAQRAGFAADSLRRWESEAFAGFDSAAALAVAASGREPVTATTDAAGWAAMELGGGAWWLVVRLRHPENIFLEHVWTVPVTISGFPLRVPLTTGNADTHWRH